MNASPSGSLSRRTLLLGAAAAAAGSVAAAFPAGAAEARRWRAAVIGHTGRGDYGHGLETIFTNRPGVELVGLADPDNEGRVRISKQISAPRRYENYRALLAAEHPQLVSLGMRHADQHHAIGLEVLRAGAHLYCEKPFTRTPAEADDLLREAAARGLKIAVAHTMRMTAPIVRLKRAVAEGLIGEIVEARAYGKQDARAGGEDMMVLGTHLFDLLRMFLGDPVGATARVLAQGRDVTLPDARLVKDNVGPVAGDEIFAQFAFAHGVNATFTSTTRLRDTVGHWGIEFFGRKGAVRVNCDIAPNVFVRRSAPWTAVGRNDAWEPLLRDASPSPPPHNLGPVDDWLAAVAEDREPECSGRNGAWAVEMVMAVYQAALRHERVSFPLKDRAHPLAAEAR